MPSFDSRSFKSLAKTTEEKLKVFMTDIVRSNCLDFMCYLLCDIVNILEF